MMGLPFEVLNARYIGQRRSRQESNRRDQPPGGVLLAFIVRYSPRVVALIEVCGGHFSMELNVGSKIELVAQEVDIGEDLRLACEVFRPVPFVENLLRECELVGVALGVEAGAGI